MKILAALIATVALAACCPVDLPAPPEEPVTTTAPQITCLALGCPGQPPELPGDGPLTP